MYINMMSISNYMMTQVKDMITKKNYISHKQILFHTDHKSYSRVLIKLIINGKVV